MPTSVFISYSTAQRSLAESLRRIGLGPWWPAIVALVSMVGGLIGSSAAAASPARDPGADSPPAAPSGS